MHCTTGIFFVRGPACRHDVLLGRRDTSSVLSYITRLFINLRRIVSQASRIFRVRMRVREADGGETSGQELMSRRARLSSWSGAP